MPTIKKISLHKQIIEPTGDQKVPVIFHVSDEMMPEEATINQLVQVASYENTFHHVVALTDIHSKPGRKNPTGSAVATKGFILPQLVDTAPNCGMRMIKTPFGTDDLTDKQIDILFQELIKVIPTKTYIGTPLSHRLIMDISQKGSLPLLQNFRADGSEIECTMNQGNMFLNQNITDKDLYRAIPRLFFRIAQLRNGILGAAGNHFLDLMRVDEIMDEEAAHKLDIKKNQYLFLMHTGSGMFGQYCSYFYTPKKKEHFSQKLLNEFARLTFLNDHIGWHKQLEDDLPKYERLDDYYAIDENSDLGRNFMIAHNAAANHGFANRALLHLNIKEAFKKSLDKDVDLPLLYDMTHVSILKENHFGQNVWVHRNGLVRANGPERMKGLPLYEEIGEPVFAPSSMSTPAYLGLATDNNASTFYSAPHGTGKSKIKTSAVPTNKLELMEKMKTRNVRLYNAQSRGIINQDAAHYKDITPGIEGLQSNQVMKPVAKMMPVAVLMA